jgi:concanavalin A-like lectin/glucanase superfamily protein
MTGGLRWQQKPPRGTQLDRGHPLAQNMVLGLTFNERTGSQVYDACLGAVGNFVVGNSTVPVWVNSGKWGSALSFAGETNGYISIPNSAALAFSGPFTLSCWVYTTAVQADYCPMIDKEGGTSSYYLGINGNADVYFGQNAGANEIDIPMPSLNAWHHICGVFTGSGLILYYDGIVAGTGGNSTAPNVTTTALSIGTYVPAGDDTFNGLIDAPMIWTRALTASEVMSVVANPWQLYAPPLAWQPAVWQAAADPPSSNPAALLAAM